MRIKRVEIIGFKSFSDRAVVHISEQITGVVGPNGCGKSNIVDAIRWCMGEQSAKHLRGKAMEDVIFAGSESRGPAPMAEVSLTFDDVGFSHEALELARHSDEAEAERALEGLAPDDEDAAVAEPVGTAVEAAVDTIEALAGDEVPAVDADAVAPAVDASAVDADEASGMSVNGDVAEAVVAQSDVGAPHVTTGTWVDAEGNPIPTPAEEVERVLADQPPAIDFSRYTEVSITRRLYRDGTSQYFINKTPCRLRDITDFFLGTGVGTKAYSIIEQGRIGQIVSARPQDRRAIIEEAAGITKFKAKKKAAEKKLDQTRQNLMRVSDIVAELDKRMGTLRRQAQKAERFRKYRTEMKDIELWKAAHRWLELNAEGQLVAGRLGAARTELEAARTSWSTHDAHVVAERADLAVEERRLVGVQNQIFELENRLRLGESKIGFETREAEELDARALGARTEIEQVATERARGAEELTARQAELATLEADVARESAEVAAREAAAGEGRQMLANAQGQLDEARGEMGARRTEIATATTQLESLERRRDEASRRLDRVTTESTQHTERLKELEREGKRVDGALADLRQTRLDLGSQNEGFAGRRDVLAEEVGRGEAEVETLRTELHRRTSRLASLREIEDRYEGFQRGTRAVMQRAEAIFESDADGRYGADDICGVVADMVRAPETLEIAVEAALGDRLGGVLVSQPEVGLAAIDFLKQGGGGRSAFVPLHLGGVAARSEAPSTPRTNLEAVEARGEAPASGVATPAFEGDATVGGPDVDAAWDEPAVARPVSLDPLAEVVADARVVADPVAELVAAPRAEVSDDDVAEVAAHAAPQTVTESMRSADPSSARWGAIEVDDRTTLVAAHAKLTAAGGGRGVLGRMSDLVGFEDGYAEVGRRLLGSTVVVEDLDHALRLHHAGVTDRMVTLEGDVIDEDGVVAGGSRDAQGAGVLAQKREIRDLDEIVGTLEHDLSEAMARLISARTEHKQVVKAIEGLRAQVHEGELAIMGHEKDESRVRVDLERHRDRLGQLGTEQLELEERLRVIEADKLAITERRVHATERIDALERLQLDLIAEVTTHRDRLDELAQVLTEARIREAQLGEKRAAAESSALRLQRSDAELMTRADRLSVEIEDAVQRIAGLREGCDQLAAELATVSEERIEQVAALDEGRAAYQARLTALTEVELAAREYRATADRLAQEVGQLELRDGKIAMTRKVVEDQIDERYQLSVRSILHDYHQRPMLTEVEDARLTELRELIDRMGTDINLTAIEEFAEVNQRFEFLSAQKIDLERAVDQLQRAIDKINKTSRKLFKDTFAAVNATFKEVFPRLFRGGQAALSLAGGDDVDLLEAGVDIMAQPPGKKNSTVEQLSGGEKALTAVALVFSIFLIKPSPFCILDEVDAPLDEANVDRYNELVREMTDRSQFIVITHNKRTMESCDNLYGVTMKEPGVSMLVSVNLNKLAARGSTSAGQPSANAAI